MFAIELGLNLIKGQSGKRKDPYAENIETIKKQYQKSKFECKQKLNNIISVFQRIHDMEIGE